uniref:Uncharacterized protein n=1 Tax=Prasinoderma coloniale TaxID=156133 RepID=A0A7R9TU72_9VIRI|mmetsp:Transcript_629/g.2433  ORF Transcript_629/g.2433 Transcript_629/m.2433 type:complete len:184 (+) Transcript_629:287-838(+)|eukprot:PRCOL_00002701-RA
MVNADSTFLDWNSGWAIAICVVAIAVAIVTWILLLIRLLTETVPEGDDADFAERKERRRTERLSRHQKKGALGRTLSVGQLAAQDMFKTVMFLGTGPATPSPRRASRSSGSGNKGSPGASSLGQSQTHAGANREDVTSSERALQPPEPVGMGAGHSGASTSSIGGATTAWRRASSHHVLEERI